MGVRIISLQHVLAGALLIGGGASGEPQQQYTTDWGTISGLAADIQDALKPGVKEKVAAAPLQLEKSPTPAVKLAGAGREPRTIALTTGMVEALVAVSHAEAIGAREKNYLKQYVESMAANGEGAAGPLPNVEKSQYWTDDVMNEQVTKFNSLAGILVSITMAQQYLGLHEKFAKEAAAANGMLNKALPAADFERSFSQGIRNALEVGIATDGLMSLLEAVEKMKVRPAWVAYFVPDSVDLAKLRRAMKKAEADFFAGKT